MIHWLFLKVVYKLAYYSQNKCKVWSNGGIMDVQHTQKPRDIQRLMIEDWQFTKFHVGFPSEAIVLSNSQEDFVTDKCMETAVIT